MSPTTSTPLTYEKLCGLAQHADTDRVVAIRGIVESVRQQSKRLSFVSLRFGRDSVPCVFSEKFVHPLHSVLSVEGTVHLDARSKCGHEMRVVRYTVLSLASTDVVLNDDSTPHQRQLYRHLALRDKKDRERMELRSALIGYLQEAFSLQGATAITPPMFVGTPCEGGATMFQVPYSSDIAKAGLTQSSQFYLEAAVPALGDVYCIAPSFRAEKSHTRRHLTEFTHAEAEYAFCSLDQLIDNIESLVDHTLRSMAKHVLLPSHNATFSAYKRPYKRLTYAQYVDELAARGIVRPDGLPYTVHDDVPEADERRFVDELGEPVFLTHFPAHLKSFYMKYSEHDDGVTPKPTDSADLLLPGCGEIVGASCRLTDYDVLLERATTEGINLRDFGMYLDLRKYGSLHTAGFGLGVERLLMCILNLDNVRQAIPFARTPDCITP